MENFAKKFNFQIKCLLDYSEFFYSDLSSNLKLLLVLLEIHKFFFRKTDIFIGVLDGSFRINKYFVASHPYHHDSLTWCVQSKQPIPKWKNIFELCKDPIVLTIYAIMTIACDLTLYFMQQFEDVQPKWDWYRISLVSMSIACGAGYPSYKPKINPTRIFSAFGLFAGIMITTTVNSLLLLFITNPIFDIQIESIPKLVNEHFDLVGDEFALMHLRRQNQVSFIYTDYNSNINILTQILYYFI